MKTLKTVILAGTVVGTMAFGGFVRAMSASQSSQSDALPSNTQIAEVPQRNGAIKNPQMPSSLTNVGQYAENIYDMAKVNNWTKAQFNLTRLHDAAKRLQIDIKGSEVAQLDRTIAVLDKAVAMKDRQAAIVNANKVTLIAANISVPFEQKMPVQVTLLDYYGRELEILSAAGNTSELKTTAGEMRKTWDVLRPSIEAYGGSAQAQKFDSLVSRLEAAKSPSEYGRLATPVLDAVDTLENVFPK